MSTFLLAFDPGASGGVAFGLDTGEPGIEKLADGPDNIAKQLHRIISSAPENVPVRTVIELVGGFAGRGLPGSMMFNFGASYGTLLGMMAVLGISPQKVPPQVWQRKLGIGTRGALSKTEWKNKLKATAALLYPKLKVTLATADALLLWHIQKQTPCPTP